MLSDSEEIERHCVAGGQLPSHERGERGMMYPLVALVVHARSLERLRDSFVGRAVAAREANVECNLHDPIVTVLVQPLKRTRDALLVSGWVFVFFPCRA